ncbi:MAG: SUMF1/EgtB/PvdO family nonheme iron enzyme [Bacteroidales bacterium]|nr:SUMF1/EgtB/PvdO family nonheme iron enzyme [Bacteroidales bacterium]
MRGRPDHGGTVRGGSWINNDRNLRCAYRNRNNPDNRNNNLGFRVVLSTFFNCWKCPASLVRMPGRSEKWRSLLPAVA